MLNIANRNLKNKWFLLKSHVNTQKNQLSPKIQYILGLPRINYTICCVSYSI